MKTEYFADLEGKIPAKPGDRVALMVTDIGPQFGVGRLVQPEVSKRPLFGIDDKGRGYAEIDKFHTF